MTGGTPCTAPCTRCTSAPTRMRAAASRRSRQARAAARHLGGERREHDVQGKSPPRVQPPGARPGAHLHRRGGAEALEEGLLRGEGTPRDPRRVRERVDRGRAGQRRLLPPEVPRALPRRTSARCTSGGSLPRAIRGRELGARAGHAHAVQQQRGDGELRLQPAAGSDACRRSSATPCRTRRTRGGSRGCGKRRGTCSRTPTTPSAATRPRCWASSTAPGCCAGWTSS